MNAPTAAALPSRTRLTLRSAIIWSIGAFLCTSIALFSYRYLLQIGAVSPLIAANLHRYPWLIIHAAGAATALLLGPAQFLPALRARYRRVHRWIGRTYAVGCLVGGAAGVMLAIGTSAGPIATAGFSLLAVLWIVSTALAWRYALKRNFVEHRRWMIRSFALTFAAVTLRVYLPISLAMHVPFEQAYRAISFLCWIPNLALAELYLARTVRKYSPVSTPLYRA
jgi:Predicted membrane protein (DUF2306)